jgi:hypothetical protein
MAAKQGPHVLFRMPNRPSCILLVPSDTLARNAGPQSRLALGLTDDSGRIKGCQIGLKCPTLHAN